MTLHDPISDFLTRLRNAQRAKHRYVDIPLSRMKVDIAKVLQKQGFIDQVLLDEGKKQMRLFLKYGKERDSLLEGLKRISMPGLRRYIGYRDIPKIKGGIGIAVVSTPQGVMDGESARLLRMGGELLCIVW
jgi:small subunit ribosomal protein S8